MRIGTLNRQPSKYAETHTYAATPWYGVLGQYLAWLSYERNLTDNTIDAYKRDAGEFLDHLSRGQIHSPDEITPDVIVAVAKRYHDRGLALSTIARKYIVIRGFLAFLYEIGLASRDMSGQLDIPRSEHKIPMYLNCGQIEKLLAAPGRQLTHRSRRPPKQAPLMIVRDTAILEFAYASGARASEIWKVRICDVNLDNGYCRLYGKGRKERLVPIHDRAIVAIRQWLRVRDLLKPMHPALFCSKTGQVLDNTAIFRLVRKYAASEGIAGPVGPHTLRHSVATHLMAGGMNMRALQEFLGHNSVATTQCYTHVDYKRLKEIHKKYHPRQ